MKKKPFRRADVAAMQRLSLEEIADRNGVTARLASLDDGEGIIVGTRLMPEQAYRGRTGWEASKYWMRRGFFPSLDVDGDTMQVRFRNAVYSREGLLRVQPWLGFSWMPSYGQLQRVRLDDILLGAKKLVYGERIRAPREGPEKGGRQGIRVTRYGRDAEVLVPHEAIGRSRRTLVVHGFPTGRSDDPLQDAFDTYTLVQDTTDIPRNRIYEDRVYGARRKPHTLWSDEVAALFALARETGDDVSLAYCPAPFPTEHALGIFEKLQHNVLVRDETLRSGSLRPPHYAEQAVMLGDCVVMLGYERMFTEP